jgi:hypothetical protein
LIVVGFAMILLLRRAWKEARENLVGASLLLAPPPESTALAAAR